MIELETFLATRSFLRAFGEKLDEETLFRVPEGFSNSIAWNLGHILVTQQLLCYKLSGLDMLVDEATVETFRKGSSPGDWSTRPDMAALLPKLTDLGERFAQDYEAGRFKDFTPYTTSAGVQLTKVEEAFAFNRFHEGIHFGYALALKRQLTG